MGDAHGLPFKGLSKLRRLEYRRQGTFHPLRYLRGLAGASKVGAAYCMAKPASKASKNATAAWW